MVNKKYGLIGHPLGHSFSQSFFNDKFHEEDIDAEYINFDIPSIENFKEILKDNQISGLNVTIPYKQQIFPYLSKIDKHANDVGAVNVIKFKREGDNLQTIGYNTDVIGFKKSLCPLLKPTHKKALILGTGGASKAVRHALESMGIEFKFVSRTKNGNNYTYPELNEEIIHTYTLIINATPLGMYPATDKCPNIPYEFITSEHICYDLVYNPLKSKFLEKSEAQGATIKNGLEMLHIQAIEAWKIWNE